MKTTAVFLIIVIAVLACGPATSGAQAPGAAAPLPDARLARELLEELVAIDTTPAKGCTKAAEAMAVRLRSAGFSDPDVLLLGGRPDRQNLVLRIRGVGKAKPILLIAHLDTVDAPREGWSEGLDPFRVTERDGFLYGRGVGDDKGAVATIAATLIRLRAEGWRPDRDILAAFTADEETGNANGVSWLLSDRHDLMDVAYCLNLDAGGGHMEKGRRVRMTVQTSEKMYLSFRLQASSPGGHSSLPDKDNAIYRLAAGLTRLAACEFPFRFNDTTRAYFGRLAASERGAVADDMRLVAKDPPDLDAARRLAAVSPYYNAILRTTAVATRIEGGHADNALPQMARATVNCRVFPGDTAEFVQETIAKALADPAITVTALGGAQPTPASPLLPEVMNAVETLSKQRWPDVPVLPVMDPWASDGARLRRAGVATYGVSGTFGELDLGNAHGANERVPVDAFNDGVGFLYELIKTLSTEK
jgi:acetylornithine deacetylase/succinyl-diaminopimelate desuccinylase-like protein